CAMRRGLGSVGAPLRRRSRARIYGAARAGLICAVIPTRTAARSVAMPLVTDYRRSHHPSNRDTVIETCRATTDARVARVDATELDVDRLLRATVNTWYGLRGAAQSEAAVREELIAIALAVPLAFVVAE